MHYLIFIPNETRQSRDVLTDAGFGSLLQPGEPDPLVFPLPGAGPDGKSGVLVLPFSSPDESRNPQPGYMPARQTWKQLPESNCWIGWQTESPPTPTELARSIPLPFAGPSITLGDGQEWMIPACMDQKHVMTPGPNGWTTKDKPRWPDLYTKAEPVLAMVERNQRDEIEFDFGLAAEFLTDLLTLNFRLTPEIVGVFELLDQDNLPRLSAIATDFVRVMTLIQELAQKKQPAPNS